MRSDGRVLFAIKFPNARPEKDQSRKSASVTGHALPAVRIPDSTGRTAPNQYHSGALPEVRSHFHHKRVGLNREDEVDGGYTEASAAHKTLEWALLRGRHFSLSLGCPDFLPPGFLCR